MTCDNLIRISVKRIGVFAKAVLEAAGARCDVAEIVASGLAWASMRGIDSHGIRLLTHYVDGLRHGRINPNPNIKFNAVTASTGLFDADHTFGHYAGMKAIEEAVRIANKAGTGWVAVANSSHCGAMSYFAHVAARHDMIGFAFTHATARLRSPGGARPFFGNNPICCVAPMQDEGPFCFDAATTSITFNAVKRYAEGGKVLPSGLVADALGRDTTDPNRAEQLIPIGDYKGFGISMMVDLFCALLSGMAGGRDVSRMYGSSMSERRRIGHFFGAIRIDAFQPPHLFKSRLQEMANAVRVEPRINTERSVMVPGDPEKVNEAERKRNGIPMLPDELERYNALARQLQVKELIV